MHTEWHPQDWIMIVEALSALDHERDRDRSEWIGGSDTLLTKWHSTLLCQSAY